MKRIVCLILSVIMAFSAPAMTSFAKPIWPSDTGIESEAGIVMDMDSKTVLFGQNIHVKKAPASITKLLTALVVIENSSLSDMVTLSKDAVYNVESGSGNKLALDEGDTLSVEDLLYALLLQSSNQSANALAEHVAGSRDAFVEMMNQRVAELGCENSHFANPSGLNDDTQLTTAYDMALIGMAAYENEKLLEISLAKSRKIPATKNNPNGVTFAMEHKLLTTTDPDSSTYFPSAVAGKTGYTSIAGQTLVTYAKKDGKRLICVTLKSISVTHYKDTIALLGFGFDNFQNVNVGELEAAAAAAGPMTIGSVTYDPADISIDPGAVATIPTGAVYEDMTKTMETVLPAGHPKGAIALITYKYDDRKVSQVYVMSAKKALEDKTDTAGTAGGSAEAFAEPESTDAARKEEGKAKKAKTPIQISAKGVFTAMGILTSAAAVCGILFYRKKKEEEKRILAERKRRRKQRLEDMGCSEEEFKELLGQRMGTDASAGARGNTKTGRK